MSRRGYDNNYLNFFNTELSLDEENDDDDYNVVEDLLSSKYNCDEKPIYLSIPKKEVYDVMNDSFCNDFFHSNGNESNSLLSAAKSSKQMMMMVSSQNNTNDNNNPLKNNEQPNDNGEMIKSNNGTKGCNTVKEKEKTVKGNKKPRKKKEIKVKEHKENKRTDAIEDNDNKEIGKCNNNNNNNNNIGVSCKGYYNSNHGRMKINGYGYKPAVSNFKYIDNNNYYNNNNNNNNNDDNKIINQMDIFEKLVFLLKQYDFAIQLLIQNLMMATDQNSKSRCYTMLFKFYMMRQQVINSYNFPQFPIKFPFSRLFNDNKDMQMRLQLSFFQPPILEILPILIKFIGPKPFSKEETYQILRNFHPFINPLYLPIVSNKLKHSLKKTNNNDGDSNELFCNDSYDNKDAQKDTEKDNGIDILLNNNNETIPTFLKKKNRRKFDSIADNLLLMGLANHGKKNLEGIQQLWLPSRSLEEIKHRIKNLTCQSAPDNLIKKQKMLQEKMLPIDDFKAFLKGLEWFGCKNKWNVISKYFLPERSPDYLEEFFRILVEGKVLPFDLDVCNYDLKKNKKRNIVVCENIMKEYSKSYAKDIDNLLKKINEDKTFFYTKEEQFETFVMPIKVKGNNGGSHINTRGKNNANAGNTGNNGNGNTSNAKGGLLNGGQCMITNHKMKSNGFDFQISYGEDGTFEKITI